MRKIKIRLIFYIFTVLIILIKPNPVAAQTSFVNPIAEGADPWVIKKDSIYYGLTTFWLESMVVWKSNRLTDRGIKRTIWNTPVNESAWNTTDIWAPEMHYINGKWYIYYTAGTGAVPHPQSGTLIWHSQRTGVLECYIQDPTAAAWVDRGMLYTGDDIDNWDGSADNNIWAIDPTPLEMNGKLYVIWSGWASTANMANDGFTQQNLYIAKMSNPYTMASNRVKIAEPIYDWEESHISPQKLNEGPEILKNANMIYLIYSTPDFWTIEYKMGQMSIEDGKDPMNPANWVKKNTPVFQGTQNVYSVGHGSFTTSPDGTENWLLYRSKQSTEGGWKRDVRLQKFTWNADGSPNFGVPEVAGTVMNVPGGQKQNISGSELLDTFTMDNTYDAWDNWVFYGWDGNMQVVDKQLHLGCSNQGLWAGDKALLRGYDWINFELEVDLKLVSGNREAGVVFQVTEPAFGLNAFKGYYAAIDENSHELFFAQMDGATVTEITRVSIPGTAKDWYHLKVDLNNLLLRIYVDDVQLIQYYLNSSTSGMAGIRNDASCANYDNFSIKNKNNVSIEPKTYIPGQLNLKQNYPNPFNPSTRIKYQVARPGNIQLAVYNTMGQKVRELVREEQHTGEYSVTFNADGLASGVYLYKLQTDQGFNVTKKLLLLK